MDNMTIEKPVKNNASTKKVGTFFQNLVLLVGFVLFIQQGWSYI